ncbi:hypothetical protein L6232_24310, partial [Shewanella sp. C31]|nr:hypothetical protein [Shewanella electrica]
QVALGATPSGDDEKPRPPQGPLRHGIAQEKGEKQPQGHQEALAEKPAVEAVAQGRQGRERLQGADLRVKEGQEEHLEEKPQQAGEPKG